MRMLVVSALLAVLSTAALAQTGQPLLPLDKPNKDLLLTSTPRWQIYADGAIRQPLVDQLSTTGAVLDTTSGQATGDSRLGVTQFSPDNSAAWSGSIALASTQDVVQSGYAATVVAPGYGTALHAALLEYRKRITPLGPHTSHGLWAGAGYGVLWIGHLLIDETHSYATVTDNTWQVPVVTNGDTTVDRANAVVFGAGFMRVFELVQGGIGNYKMGMAIEAGISGRQLAGDITLPEFDYGRRVVLGTDHQGFAGLEGGLQIYVGHVVAFFHLYDNMRGDSDVRGITKTQVLAVINVRGPLYDSGAGSN